VEQTASPYIRAAWAAARVFDCGCSISLFASIHVTTTTILQSTVSPSPISLSLIARLSRSGASYAPRNGVRQFYDMAFAAAAGGITLLNNAPLGITRCVLLYADASRRAA